MKRQDRAIGWLERKFNEDISDFNPENSLYYKYHVCHFFDKHFTRERIEGKRILDIGCGPGFYACRCARRGATVVGVDSNRYLINKAKSLKHKHRLKNIEFHNTNIQNYLSSHTDETFDIAFAIDMIVTFFERNQGPTKPDFKFMSQLASSLGSEGKFYIIELHPCFKVNYHYRLRHRKKSEIVHWPTLEEMSNILFKSGLAITRILEPRPNPILKKIDINFYNNSLRRPAMIVYEVMRR